MLRKLLACLALLTGLAAAGTPAQAEVAVVMAPQVEASARREAVGAGQCASSATLPVAHTFFEGARALSDQGIGLGFSGVYVRIDRARE